MAEIVLTVGGQRYGGWKTARVSRSIEHVAGTFSLITTERWAEQRTPRPIRLGHAARLEIADQVVITGYVDSVRPSYDSSGHQVAVAGRDRTGDLVDCSVLQSQWADADLLRIAREVCEPFGVSVASDVDVGAAFELETATVQRGETALELLARLARHRAVLLVPDRLGGLRLTKASTRRATTALVEGGNILAAEGDFSWRERYSRYVVLGSHAGFDESTPDQNAHPLGEATDPDIDRYRPLVLLAEEQVDDTFAAKRAEWEARTRIGRGNRVFITVQGWLQGDGSLWELNTLATIRAPALGLDDVTWSIVSVTFILDEQGSRTELILTPRSALDVLAEPEDVEAPYG